ncbi:MAG: hypothetical protein N2449_07295, partial [Bacteroidales bacterium]|nr:hypothetical protein [Bacteroidales bacterium]
MGANKYFQFLVPKDRKFYPYFLKVADNLLEGAELLVQLMNSNNWEERSKIIDKIKEKEKKGDDYT